MMKFSAKCCLALAAMFLAAAAARAQEADDGTLHVLRPVIHAEQETAELCLEFDHDLDASDHDRAAIKLESGGKNIPVRTQSVSVAGNSLCVPSLEHRRDYRIVVSGVRGAKGEKLATPYALSFSVPDRQPSLDFTGNENGEGFKPWNDEDPVLRSINVPYVHVELYRVAGADTMFAAWRDRQQTTLVPSESATFGHDHGQLVWSGEIPLAGASDKTSEHAVPLKQNLAEPGDGLYLVVARGPEPKAETKPETDAETGSKAAPLAPVAAAWLMRSSLHLRVVRDDRGLYGVVEKTGANGMPANIRLVAADANAATLGEARSDANGVGFVALSPDKLTVAVTLAAFGDKGEAAFADLASPGVTRFVPPGDDIALKTDKDFYAPATEAAATLVAHDAEGHALSETGTVLALLSANGDTYSSFPVPATANGIAHTAFPVPAIAGLWPMVWRRGDGSVLAQSSLRVTDDPAAPHLEMTADRAVLAHDGAVNLTLKSIDADGDPSPYIAGRVFVAWNSPDTLAHEWKGYQFGDGIDKATEAAPVVSFVTDEKGLATLRLSLTPPDDHAALHSATLTVRSDSSAGVAPPAPLTLPLKPKENIVGVKPLAPQARFPENGFARFDVIELDADGHRRAADDLYYRIYEEGRSFDWYQADGRWSYKLRQRGRRVGGGTLTLAASGENTIEWPVAAGLYRLEITDASGAVRAAADFSAGTDAPEEAPAAAALNLVPSAATWRPGEDIDVKFKLDKPSAVTAIVGDDRVRTILHQTKPAGSATLIFTPGKDWSGPVTLDVETENPDSAGHLVLPRAAEGSSEADAAKPAAEPVTLETVLPRLLRQGDVVRLAAAATNNGKAPETLHYVFEASAGLKPEGASSGSVALAAGQTRELPFGLAAIRAGTGIVKLDIAGAARLRMNREWTLPVAAEDFTFLIEDHRRLEPRQTLVWPSAKTGARKERKAARAREDGVLFLSPIPLYDAPSLLATLLSADPLTTGETADLLDTLRLWRGSLIAAGLMPEAELDLRRRGFLVRLLSRQKPDGGFAALPGNPPGDSDLVSTSRALVALAHSALPAAKPAADRAAAWIKQRLDNSWFDEHERPARAAAYAALAEAGRLDNASLHYFSDTSAKTAVPPLAAVQLAFAFARIGDQPASNFWIDRSGVKKDPASLAPAFLPALAGNGFFDAASLLPVLEALSSKGAIKNSNLESVTDFLRALETIEDGKGSWRVTVGTDKRNPKGVLIVDAPTRNAPLSIHNDGDIPVFISAVRRAVPKEPAMSASRHIYELSGTEVNASHPLARGKTYLVVLDGSWAAGMSILVHDDPAAALRVTGCLPPGPIEADDRLAWLKSQVLTPTLACESGEGGIDVLIARKENTDASPWRVAYLAKAQWEGNFAMLPAHAWPVSGEHAVGMAPVLATAPQRVDVR